MSSFPGDASGVAFGLVFLVLAIKVIDYGVRAVFGAADDAWSRRRHRGDGRGGSA